MYTKYFYRGLRYWNNKILSYLLSNTTLTFFSLSSSRFLPSFLSHFPSCRVRYEQWIVREGIREKRNTNRRSVARSSGSGRKFPYSAMRVLTSLILAGMDAREIEYSRIILLRGKRDDDRVRQRVHDIRKRSISQVVSQIAWMHICSTRTLTHTWP